MRLLTALGFIAALVAACNGEETPRPDTALVYFLATEKSPTRGESFIVPIKDPAVIQMARDLIASDEQKIVVAKITRDRSDNYSLNRDLLKNRNWTWHISNVEGFADITAEIYDGWPSYVEENYAEWVNNTKGSGTHGVIGFWNFTITREVSYEELYGN